MSAVFADLAPSCRFTRPQVAAMTEWSASRPIGMTVAIQHDPEGRPEVAEIGRGLTPSRYLLSPTDTGTLILATAFGPGWEWPTVEAALAWVTKLELARLGLAK